MPQTAGVLVLSSGAAPLVKQRRLAAYLANTPCCCSLIAVLRAVQKRKSIKKIRLADDLGEDDELDDMED